MEFDYYLHKSEGMVDDYFGHIGEPIKVSAAKHYARKISGFRATKVPQGSSMRAVLTKAIVDDGMSLNCTLAKQIFEKFCDA